MAWDPTRDLVAWQERLRLVPHPPESWTPPIDVYETATAYVIAAEVPGLGRDQIELAVEEWRLTIRGQRSDRMLADHVVHFHQVERGHGAFARKFEFAEKIDTAGVSADLADGVLTVTLPKVPPLPPRRIEVR